MNNNLKESYERAKKDLKTKPEDIILSSFMMFSMLSISSFSIVLNLLVNSSIGFAISGLWFGVLIGSITRYYKAKRWLKANS